MGCVFCKNENCHPRPIKGWPFACVYLPPGKLPTKQAVTSSCPMCGNRKYKSADGICFVCLYEPDSEPLYCLMEYISALDNYRCMLCRVSLYQAREKLDELLDDAWQDEEEYGEDADTIMNNYILQICTNPLRCFCGQIHIRIMGRRLLNKPRRNKFLYWKGFMNSEIWKDSRMR
jgi:hypothetical protein